MWALFMLASLSTVLMMASVFSDYASKSAQPPLTNEVIRELGEYNAFANVAHIYMRDVATAPAANTVLYWSVLKTASNLPTAYTSANFSSDVTANWKVVTTDGNRSYVVCANLSPASLQVISQQLASLTPVARARTDISSNKLDMLVFTDSGSLTADAGADACKLN